MLRSDHQRNVGPANTNPARGMEEESKTKLAKAPSSQNAAIDTEVRKERRGRKVKGGLAFMYSESDSGNEISTPASRRSKTAERRKYYNLRGPFSCEPRVRRNFFKDHRS